MRRGCLLLQWYEKPSNLKLLQQEEEDAKALGLASYYSVNKNLVMHKKKFYKGKPLTILYIYSSNFPYVPINVIILEGFINMTDLANSNIHPFIEGGHNFEGMICYQNHEPIPGRNEPGIREVVDRVENWFKIGRIQYNEEDLIAGFNIGKTWYILPEICENNCLSDGAIGVFQASYIGNKTYIINQIELIEPQHRTMVLGPIPRFKIIENEAAWYRKGIVIFVNTLPELKLVKEPFTRVPNLNKYINKYKKGKKDGFLRFANEVGFSPPFPLIIICQGAKTPGFGITVKGDKLDLENYREDSLRITRLRVKEDIFSRATEEDKKNLDDLSQKTVAILGLGALGSTIAVELARSGVHKFVLCDKDRLDVPNIGRHDLTLSEVGCLKVKGVGDKINMINPASEVTLCTDDLRSLDPKDELFSKLLQSDLIISTVDEHPARRVINSYLVPQGKRILFTGVYYRSVAGYAMIAEKEIACLECLDRRIDYYIQNKEIPDFPGMVPKELWEQCSAPTFPGGSVRVHLISLMTARIALDLLQNRRVRDNQNRPYNYFLLNMEPLHIDQRLFSEGFMDCKKYFVQGINQCRICGETVF